MWLVQDLDEDSTPAVVPEVLDKFGRVVEGPDGKDNAASGGWGGG